MDTGTRSMSGENTENKKRVGILILLLLLSQTTYPNYIPILLYWMDFKSLVVIRVLSRVIYNR